MKVWEKCISATLDHIRVNWIVAEAVGFEPTERSSRSTVFKTAAFDHSAKPPVDFL